MAKVFIVEDEGRIRNLLRVIVRLAGHEVVLEASGFNEAISKAGQAAALGVDFAILDGSLDSPNDGEKIAEVLRKEAPSIKILGHSANIVSFGDKNVQKPVGGVEQFRKAFADLGFE